MQVTEVAKQHRGWVPGVGLWERWTGEVAGDVIDGLSQGTAKRGPDGVMEVEGWEPAGNEVKRGEQRPAPS